MSGCRATRVLVLTTYADEDAILPALRAGGPGVPDRRHASAEQIEAAIHAVHAGQIYLELPSRNGWWPRCEPARGRRVRSRHGAQTSRRAHRSRGRGAQAARVGPEQRRDRLLGLFLSNATVKTHINRIFAKTGARDRAQAVRYAYQHGMATTAQ